MNALQQEAPQTQDDTLDDILFSLQSQRYEMGGVFTIGGATGIYQLKSPFNTECEYALISVDTNSSTSSSFAVSQSNPSLTAPPTSTTVINLGTYSQGSETSNPLEGIIGFVVNTSANVYVPVWQPLGRGAIIYLATNVTGANTAVYANIAFRRSYLHMLPDRARHLPPATHSRPYSRRNIRMIEGMSKQYSGFDAQYPTRQDGKETYNHEAIPWEQDARGSLNNVRGQGRSGR